MKKSISISDIRAKVAEIETNAKVDPNRLQEIYNSMNDKVAQFRSAVVDGNQKKADALAIEIDNLNREKQIAKSMQYVAETGGLKHQLEANSNLQDLCKQLEKAHMAAADGLMAEREALIAKFKQQRAAFLQASYALGKNINDIATLCGEMELAAEYRHDMSKDEKAQIRSKYPQISFSQVDIAQKQRESYSAGVHGQPLPASVVEEIAAAE